MQSVIVVICAKFSPMSVQNFPLQKEYKYTLKNRYKINHGSAMAPPKLIFFVSKKEEA
jgi:hypothetical protein